MSHNSSSVDTTFSVATNAIAEILNFVLSMNSTGLKNTDNILACGMTTSFVSGRAGGSTDTGDPDDCLVTPGAKEGSAVA